jgi:hypothetical protein
MVAEASERPGGLLPAQEYRVHGDLPQVAQVGLQALQVAVRQCRLQARAGGIAVGGMHDELGDHRVVEGRDLAAALDPGVHPHVVREPGLGQQAGGGLEMLARVLGIDPRLDRVAPRGPRAQGLQGGQFGGRRQQHPLDEIDAGDLFGDAVLDLQPGIHLQEIERAGLGVVEVFDGTRAAIADPFAQGLGIGQQAGPGGLGEVGRGSFLDHLLVAPLQ